MTFNVDFHYFFDTDECEYESDPINYIAQITTDPSLKEFWSRHPDLTLLAIL